MSEKYNYSEDRKKSILFRAEVISHELDKLKEQSFENPNEIIDPTAYDFIKDISDIARRYYQDGGADNINEDELIGLYYQISSYDSIAYRHFIRDLMKEKGVDPLLLDSIILEAEGEKKLLTKKELLIRYHNRNN